MKTLATALLLIGVVACTSEAPRKRPADIYSPDSMALFMAEIQLINAKSQHRESRRKKLMDMIKREQQLLFDSLGITKETFDKSMNYYLEDAEEMEQLHIEAMDILSQRMAELKSEQSKDEKANSSDPVQPAIRKQR